MSEVQLGHVEPWESGWRGTANKPALVVETAAPEDTFDAIAWSPDGLAFAAAIDRTVRVFTPRRSLVLDHGDAGVRAIAYGTRAWLATGAEDGYVRVWDAETGQLLEARRVHGRTVRGVSCDPRTSAIASYDNDGQILVWRGDGAMRMAATAGKFLELVDGGSRLLAVDGRAISLIDVAERTARTSNSTADESNDRGVARVGRELFIAGSQVISVVDVDTHVTRRRLPLGGPSVTTLACSVDASRIAVGTLYGELAIWNGGTGERICSIGVQPCYAPQLAFHPRSRLLLSAGHDRTIKMWDVRGRRPRLRGALILVGEADWAVVDGDAFDASPGARVHMHWVVEGKTRSLEEHGATTPGLLARDRDDPRGRGDRCRLRSRRPAARDRVRDADVAVGHRGSRAPAAAMPADRFVRPHTRRARSVRRAARARRFATLTP